MKKYLLSTFLLGFIATGSFAQAPGSSSTYGGLSSTKSISGGSSSDISESLYIGPGTHTIDGVWEIYSKRVIIDPLAVISGIGTIKFFGPDDIDVSSGGPFAASPTLIDGNAPSGAANIIDVNIEHHNRSGMQLTEMGFPSELILEGWMNITTSSTVYAGKDFSLEVDGADITLGTGVTGDLRFDDNATISNYRPERMIITNNSVISHMVKENFTGAFTFPVGIADGDYTPATLSNVSALTAFVSVQDYVASSSPEQTLDPGPNGVPSDGMKRTWHIYGNTAGTGTTVNLQHNSSSNQSGFTDASHFVTQWGSSTPNTSGDYTVDFTTSPWQSNITAAGATGTMITPAGTLAGSTMRSRSYSALATGFTDPETYFTKSSDPFHPLPVTLLNFTANAKECDVLLTWEVGVEKDIKEYRVQYSTDGKNFSSIAGIGTKGSNSKYSYLHSQPVKGTNLYRIAMIEKDDTYTYSPIEKVTIDCGETVGEQARIMVYPNPSTGIVWIEGMGADKQSTLRVMNLHGRLMQESKSAGDKDMIDISLLPAASYVIQVIQGDAVKLSVAVVKQ